MDSFSSKDTTAGPTTDSIHATPFETMQDLLQSKDDTSRFVGLALLKSMLDNKQLAPNSQELQRLWEAISPKFLDRLLRARRNNKTNKAEAQNMVDLAVAVLHTFATLLPEDFRHENRLVGRTETLVQALEDSSPVTTQLILQTLLTIVSYREGAVELLGVEALSPLIDISAKYAIALDVLDFTWANAAVSPQAIDRVRESIGKTVPILLHVFKGTDAVTFIKFIGSLFPKLAPEAFPRDPQWLKPLISMLRDLVISRPTLAGRAAYTQLASVLLQVYPATCPPLIFEDSAATDREAKPFSYLFVNLLLIDIRSSFPNLLSQLNGKEYPAISQRLAAAFDVISSFVGFLVRGLDDDSGFAAFNMPPDLLLKLRKDIAETLSLTIEYLRDRWDASFAGASGLHPSARTGTAATSEGTRLTLTWDTMEDDIRADPLILAGIRTLAIWIREDENENLRNESAGIMDMQIELYKSSTPNKLDFRYPILLALEGILETDDGVISFLEQGGWETIVRDLDGIQQDLTKELPPASLPTNEAARGVEIVRVLLAVLDHQSTSFVQEQWMEVVTAATSMKHPSATSAVIVLEFQISVLQLAAALLSKAAGGMQKRYVTSIPAISGLARQMEEIARAMEDAKEGADFVGLLEDIQLELGNLRYGMGS